MSRRGFVMIVALVYGAVLAVIVTTMAYFIASETKGVGFQLDDAKAFYLAQAGVDKAYRQLRDEYLTPPHTGTADLRGAIATAAGPGISDVLRIRYIGEGSGSATIAGTGIANLQAFDSNYTQTRITNVYLCAAACMAKAKKNATLQASYSVNGVTGHTVLSWPLNSTTMTTRSIEITADRAWSWPTILGSTFTLSARRTAGVDDINLDAIFLRVTYVVDAGIPDRSPEGLGDGFIQSVSVADEAGKAHLNYASQALLSNLFTNFGITDASTKATAIVNYVATKKPFDSIEEVQQAGITAADFAIIKNYVTVYSYVNQNCYNTHTVSPLPAPVFRAPINVNTASFEVLKAVFDPLGLRTGRSTSLANAIINFRGSSGPFGCFYSSNSLITNDFVDFVNSQGFLNSSEKNAVIDNADASLLAPIPGFINSTQTTEFCYAAKAYMIQSVGKIALQSDPAAPGINLRVSTVVGNDGSLTFPVYANQPQAAWKGYWKENYE